MAYSITYDSATLDTLDPKTGDVLRTESYSGSPLDKNSIGEYKRLTANYKIDGGDDLTIGRTIRFVPGLYTWGSQSSGIGIGTPSNYYSWSISGSTPTGTDLIGTLIASIVSPQDNRIKNYEVYLNLTDGTHFSIITYFFVTYDEEGYLPATGNNHARFLKDAYSDPNELVVVSKPIYVSSSRAIAEFLQVVDMSTLATYFSETFFRFEAGFYSKSAENHAPFFTGDTWTLNDATDLPTVLTNLSGVHNTRVTFSTDGDNDLTDALLYLIRVDTANDNVLFTANYEVSWAKMATDGTTGTLIDGALVSPSLAPDGTMFYCTIDKSALVPGARYRFIAICYELGGDEGDNITSFISPEYSVDPSVPFNGDMFDHTMTYTDYHKTYPAETMICTVEERLKHTLSLDYSSGQFSADILARLGLTVPNDIRRYLKSIRLEVFTIRTDEAGILYVTNRRDVFEDITINRQPDGSYSPAGALTVSGGLDNFAVNWNFRVRYEDHIPNLYTYFDNTLQPLALENQNWGGRTLIVRITLELYYHDAPTPFTDLVQFDSQLQPRDYTTVSLHLYGSEGDDLGNPAPACQGEKACFISLLNVYDPSVYRLIATIEPMNGNSATVEEAEAYTTGSLPQETTLKITDEDTDYTLHGHNIYATFCVDTSLLNIGTQYKVSALAKQYQPPKTFKDSTFDSSFN